MSEMDRILKENIEEYEAAEKNANKYIQENREELSKRFGYAKALEKPIKEKQVFFVWEENSPGLERAKELFSQLRKLGKKEYTYVVCVYDNGDASLEGAQMARRSTEAFWEALAVSRYVVSSVNLSVSFVKRPEQIYLNTMDSLWERQVSPVDLYSLYARELLKTDFIMAPSLEEAKKVWEERLPVGKLYDGRILTGGVPEAAKALLEKGRGEQGEEPGHSLKSDKKRLLILTSWKDTREHRWVVKSLLGQMDTDKYQVAVLSSWCPDPWAEQEFAAFPRDTAGLMYRGRMILKEEDHRFVRILEKHPDAYVKVPELREHMDRLMEREWRRIFGETSFDLCLVLGSQGYQQYYLSLSKRFSQRELGDLDFLENLRERQPGKWKTALSAYDKIYSLPGGITPGSYGAENAKKLSRLLPLPEKRKGETALPGEKVMVENQPYLVCDRWQEEGHIRAKLLLLPEEGSVLVNAQVLPDEKKKRLLETLKTKSVCLIGAKAPSYTSLLPDAVVLDEALCTYLYLLPQAGEFFDRFCGYVGRGDGAYDLCGEICRIYKVPPYREKG